MAPTGTPSPLAPSGASAPTLSPRQRISNHPVRERVRVTEAFARLTGRSEGWCHAKLYAHPRLAELSVAAIQAYRQAGDVKGLAGFAALLRDALNDTPAPRLSRELIISAADADAKEDIGEAAFLTAPSRETAGAYVRQLDMVLAKTSQLRAAVAEKYLA